jgi:hypothetical protein
MSTKPKQRAEKWSVKHKTVFRQHILNGRINPKRSDTAYIDKIREKYFKDCPVATFHNNYKASIAEYRIRAAIDTAITKQGLPRLLKVSSSRADCCLCSLIILTLVNTAEEDESNNESDDAEDKSEEESADDEEVDKEELQGLQEDLKIPALCNKKGSTPKKKSAVDELSVLISGLTLSSGTTQPTWYSPSWTFPFTIYAYRDEEHPVEHMIVEVLTPNVPNEFVHTMQVMPFGTKLKLVVGTPCWFYEERFIQKRFEGDFHTQHADVDCFVKNVFLLLFVMP